MNELRQQLKLKLPVIIRVSNLLKYPSVSLQRCSASGRLYTEIEIKAIEIYVYDLNYVHTVLINGNQSLHFLITFRT